MSRKRKKGTTGHTAQIVIKRGSAIVHRENKTFDRLTVPGPGLFGERPSWRSRGSLMKCDAAWLE